MLRYRKPFYLATMLLLLACRAFLWFLPASATNLSNVNLMAALETTSSRFLSGEWGKCKTRVTLPDIASSSWLALGALAQLDCPAALRQTEDAKGRALTDVETFWLGYALEQSGRHTQALETWRSYPAIGRYFMFLAEYNAAGANTEAVERFTRLAVEIEPQNWPLQLERGRLLRGSDPTRIPHDLEERIRQEIHNLWTVVPAWQWGRPSFEGGMRERVLWKLNNHNVERSYYRGIIDEELFVMAIAADLAHTDSVLRREPDPVLADVLDIARIVFQSELVYGQDGGWILQPGVWRDHPDYTYSGYTQLALDLVPKPVLNIAPDSSHSHRMPLWLLSLAHAYPNDDERHVFYQVLLDGLRIQFLDHVLVPPSSEVPFPRLTNFMDGWNGVYRYNYQTVGENLGYGPYQLSGILLESWWIFLGTDDLRYLYAEMSRQFPLRQDELDLYVGPNTTRERHPLVTWPDYFTNGFAELYTLAASRLQGW